MESNRKGEKTVPENFKYIHNIKKEYSWFPRHPLSQVLNQKKTSVKLSTEKHFSLRPYPSREN